ncbi:MAG TPA: DUF4912 domain-containing protein [bacterium]|nr:DUF4912 domain-containing protein [bacterium]
MPAAPKRAKAGHVAENVHEKIAVVPEQKPPLHRSKIQSRPRPPLNGSKSLPRRGETQMVAFIRDPQCIFTYWEITPEGIEDVKRQLTDEFHHSSMVLMVFKIGANGHPELVQEIKVEPGDMNRYIDLNDPRGTYYLEVAQKTPSGRTVVYVRSNKITLGPSEFGGSDVSARQWETPAGILEYFSKEEFTENYYSPGGPSSMDSLKRKKGHYSSSDFR